MPTSSFDEKIIGLKTALDASRTILEKQLKAKEDEIENLKKELELRTSASSDVEPLISQLKSNLKKSTEENQRQELELSDIKRKLILAEKEILGMDKLIKTGERDFKQEIQNKLDQWQEGEYTVDEIKGQKEKWLAKLQSIDNNLKDAMSFLGYRQKRITKRKSLFRSILAGVIVGIVIISAGTIKKYFYKDVAYSAPYSNPSGIAFDGKNLWTADWLSMTAVRHNMDESLSVAKKYQLPINPFGLAWDGQNFWTSDSWAKKINKHSQDLSVIASYKSPAANPGGLCWDGKNLWSVDTETRKIYKHKMDSALSIDRSYDSPGNSPSAIFFDGKNLWSCDSASNRIYKHSMDEKLSVKNVYVPKSYSYGKLRMVGITSDDKNIWTIAEGENKIYKHKLSSMTKLK